MICKSNGAIALKQTFVNSSAESPFLQPWKPGAVFFWCFGNTSFFDTLFFSPSVMLTFPNTLIISFSGAQCVYLECCKTLSKSQFVVIVPTSRGMRAPLCVLRLSGVAFVPGALLHPPNLTRETPRGYWRCPRGSSRAMDRVLSTSFEALDFFLSPNTNNNADLLCANCARSGRRAEAAAGSVYCP